MAITFAHSDAGTGAGILAPSSEAVAAGVEPEEMNSGLLVQVVLGVAAIVVILVVVVFQIMNLEVQTVQAQLAEGVGVEARAEVELAGAQKLTRYALIDAETGTYQIPIDRAMELMASETYQQPGQNYTDEIALPTGR
jgi:hypothetical protein